MCPLQPYLIQTAPGIVWRNIELNKSCLTQWVNLKNILEHNLNSNKACFSLIYPYLSQTTPFLEQKVRIQLSINKDKTNLNINLMVKSSTFVCFTLSTIISLDSIYHSYSYLNRKQKNSTLLLTGHDRAKSTSFRLFNCSPN